MSQEAKQAYEQAQEQFDEQAQEQVLEDDGIELSNDAIAQAANIEKLQLALAKEREIRLRDAAEFENIKKRIERQHASDLEYANSKIIKDLLPLLDALDQAAEYDAANEGIANLIKLFSKVLADYGVSKIEPNLGDAIDPQIHEVLLNQPNSELEPGSVSMIMQAGYKLKDRVIRAAKVAANN